LTLTARCGDDRRSIEQTSKEAKSLVKKLLDKDPRKRLGSEHGAADIKVLVFITCKKEEHNLTMLSLLLMVMVMLLLSRNIRSSRAR
jgi:serine/threonine protein kinase